MVEDQLGLDRWARSARQPVQLWRGAGHARRVSCAVPPGRIRPRPAMAGQGLWCPPTACRASSLENEPQRLLSSRDGRGL
eukprot:5938359-Alexandrium_andersonii.AAC.1